jgi:hypothetical protein
MEAAAAVVEAAAEALSPDNRSQRAEAETGVEELDSPLVMEKEGIPDSPHANVLVVSRAAALQSTLVTAAVRNSGAELDGIEANGAATTEAEAAWIARREEIAALKAQIRAQRLKEAGKTDKPTAHRESGSDIRQRAKVVMDASGRRIRECLAATRRAIGKLKASVRLGKNKCLFWWATEVKRPIADAAAEGRYVCRCFRCSCIISFK